MSFKRNLSLNCVVIMSLISHVYVCEPGINLEQEHGLCEIPTVPVIVTNTCKQNGEWSEEFVRCGM